MKTCISTYLHRLTLIAALLIVLWPLQSCEDDFPSNKYEIGDGESLVTGEITFQPLKSSLNGDARGENGNLISSVNNLNVVIYKVGGEDGGATFFKKHYLTGTRLGTPQTNTSVPDDYKDYQGNVATKAEEQTKKYKFELPEALPFGKYYIYAVANMNRELEDEETTTPDVLQSIVVDWQEDKSKMSLNGQMFGYFNPGGEKADGTGNLGNSGPNEQGVYAAPAIIVNQAQTHVHAWMRRLASKLTICFDGSQLSEDVYVYIHKATIKQIPKQCVLGKNSAVGGKFEKDTVNYITGQTIYYNAKGQAVNTDPAPAEANFRQWLEIAKGTPIQGARDSIGGKLVYHPENALSLFFYENMQGDFSKNADKDKYDKRQNESQTGTNIISPSQPDYKDNVPCGTYIEVEGFYVNRRPESQSSGKIIYRFMLGQDITYNYDVMRNQHYKLDMCFKGLANQVDWHITYQEETPGNYPPDLLYVPYLYNTRTELPIRLTGNPTRVWVQMVENNWAPYDSTSATSVPPATVGTGKQAFKWAKDVYDGNQYYYGLHRPTQFYTVSGNGDGCKPTTTSIPIYTKAEVSSATKIPENEVPDEVLNNAVYGTNGKATPLWAGFLALQAPSGITKMEDMPVGIFNHPYAGGAGSGNPDWYSNSNSVNNNQKYFLGKGGGDAYTTGNTNPQHIRVLTDLTPGKTVGSGLNAYKVSPVTKVNGQDSRTIYLPLFTRPKAIIYISGFSGNNPYEYYPRKAVLRITAEYKLTDGRKKIVSKEMTVVQERRVVNPKAVWRKYNNPGTFKVSLSQLKSPTDTTFTKIYSYGSWKAEVVKGGTDFEISGKKEGGTRDPIEFTINFKKEIPQGETRCGYIDVTYHSGTCQHRIFLRQGYDKPIALYTGGAEWSSYCLYRFTTASGSKAELTKTPTAVGSFFRRLAGTNYDFRKGIKAENNIKYGPLVEIYNKKLELTDNSQSTWQEVPGEYWTKTNTPYTWPVFHVDAKDKNYKLPTYADFNNLIAHCDFGYGVLYADASKTSMSQVEAYGQDNYDNDHTGSGMRGVIAYNRSDASQLFFPIGAYGVGRRTLKTNTPEQKGYLRYGALGTELKATTNLYNAYRPVCYNLPASPGALYWIESPTTHSEPYVGWDMNYFDMSFNGQDYGATNAYDGLGHSPNYGSDAFLIKPILAK